MCYNNYRITLTFEVENVLLRTLVVKRNAGRGTPAKRQYEPLRSIGAVFLCENSINSAFCRNARRFFIARKEKSMRRIIEFLEEHAETMIAGAIGGLASAVILLTISG